MFKKSSKGQTGQERRQQVRLQVNDVLDGFIVNEEGPETPILLNDISKGGISFLTEKGKSYKVKEKLLINLYFKNSKKFFQCNFIIQTIVKDNSGKIRHGVKVMDDSKNEMALEFLADFVGTVTISKQARAAV